MGESRTTLKKIGIVAGVVLTLAVAGTVPMLIELRTISIIMEQYRLDDAVQKQRMKDPRNLRKGRLSDVLDSPFLQRYGLITKDYLNKDGYFSPNGINWIQWDLKTKTAALMMWAPETFSTAWQIRNVIRQIDDYYSRNDKSMPVVHVVLAIVQK